MFTRNGIFIRNWLCYGVLLICYFIFLWYPMKTYAQECQLPSDVKVVKNEKEMLSSMIRGMRKHKSQFAFYYPGIAKDFKKYRKESVAYSTFMEQLSKRDGYTTGIVSGICITICGTKRKYVRFQFGYLTTKRQEKKIDKKVKGIVKRIGKGSRVQRARKAHDYLIKHMRYDPKYYSPFHAFSNGRGICMSYSLAYQRLLQEMKIPCVYVKGKNHAWNMVKIGGYWYNVDVTWDDSRKDRYYYFLKSDLDFPGHRRPKSRYLSSLKKAKYSYNIK